MGPPLPTQAGLSNRTTTVRTVDREKLRDKARMFQMKENLRLALCGRIQQQYKKSPALAQELASEVLKMLQQRGVSVAQLSDDMLAGIVQELSSRRQEQMMLAKRDRDREPVSERGNNEMPVSGRRSQPKPLSGARPRRSRGGSDQSGGQSDRSATGSGDDDNVYVTQSQLQQMSLGFRLPPKVSPKKNKGNGIWEDIVKFSSVKEQQEAKRKADMKMRQREEFATRLDAQVTQKERQQQAERDASAKYHREAAERRLELDEEERQKERDRLERAMALTKIQNEQRLAKMQQLERERLNKKTQEQKMAELLRQQKEEDSRREQAKRAAEKQRIAMVQHENEQQLEQKRQGKARDREFEMKLAEDYFKMEDAKEAARVQQLQVLANNIQAKMKFFGDTAKADMDARLREEEARVLKCQEEYARQQVEAERKKKADAELRSLSQQEYLKSQIQEKKLRELAEKRDLNKQAELWKQERMDAERRERMANQQRAIRNMSQKEVLLQQIRDKEQRSLEADQTMLEIQLNASLLQKIHKQTGETQANGANVVSETQNRSREVTNVVNS